MRAYPVPFTAGGKLKFEDTTDIVGEQLILGLTSSGFTSVKIYDGTDNTGPLLLNAVTNQTITLNHEVWAQTGVFVEVAGSGKGTVWLVG